VRPRVRNRLLRHLDFSLAVTSSGVAMLTFTRPEVSYGREATAPALPAQSESIAQ